MLSTTDFNLILNSCDSGIIVLDQDSSIVIWNEWMVKHSGITEANAINNTLSETFGRALYRYLDNAINDSLKHGYSAFLSPRIHKHALPLYRESRTRPGSERIHQKIVVSRIEGEDKKRFCLINISDVNASINREQMLLKQTHELKMAKEELIKSNEEIQKLAFHDSLTGLANRNLFLDHLNMAIAYSKGHHDMFAIMFIDMDHFKQVNDTYGHDIGDEFLIEISKRINNCVGESDTAARFGGDEFAIIQTQFNDIHCADDLAKKITKSLSKPVKINDLIIHSGCSIGVAIYPEDAETSTDLLKNADLAMYHVKQSGKSNWQFYDESMRSPQSSSQKIA